MKSTRRNPSTPKPETEVADSMKQAASILKVPIAILQKLKASGCPGFRNGRVHLDEVRQWLADPKNSESIQDDPEDIDSAKLAVLVQRARLLRIKADTEEKILMPVADVKRAVTQMVQASKIQLLRIPRRTAQRIAALSDWIEIEGILDDEVYSALEELHRGGWHQHPHCEHCGCLAASSTPTESPTTETTNPVRISDK